MQITIKTTRLAITDALRDYCQLKMDKIEKYLGSTKVVNCDVEIAKTVGDQRHGDIFRAEVNLEVPHQLLRVERTAADMYKAIDKAQEHLKLVIKKYKEKAAQTKKAGA